MDDQELKEALLRLEEQQQKIVTQLAVAENRRDFWDKLSAISPIISGMAIALSALLCTYQYNQQQIKLQEAQTIERFIPHLLGNDTSKRMAILAMKTLVNTDLAAKYAAMFPSAGTISALKTIAQNGDSQDKEIVSKALHKTETELSDKSENIDSVEAVEDIPSDDVKQTHQDAQPVSVDAMQDETAEGTKMEVTAPGDKAKAPTHQTAPEEKVPGSESQNKHEGEPKPAHSHSTGQTDRAKPTTAQENASVEL
jgi:hypothetical protein